MFRRPAPTSDATTHHDSPTPRRRGRPLLARLTLATTIAAGTMLALAGSASAHVQVGASSTEPGAYSQLTFRVPTESATASTTKIKVTMPTDHPFAVVSARPLAGWAVAIKDAKLPKPVTDDDGATLTKAPHTVTWTADKESAIAPGQFQEFDLLVGPLPASGTVVLPATQTYSDGTVVNWDQKPKSDGSEPEHPAPSFEVVAADATPASPSPSASAEPTPSASATPVSSPTVTVTASAAPAPVASSDVVPSADHTARVVGVIGIVVGLIGAGVGIAALVVARRRTAGEPAQEPVHE